MVRFALQLVLTAALLLIVAGLVTGVQVDSWGSAILAALVLGMVNAVVRPLMLILTLPLTVVTFGLFLLVINGLMLQLVAVLVPGLHVGGFGSALVGALLLTLMNVLVSVLVGQHDEPRR